MARWTCWPPSTPPCSAPASGAGVDTAAATSAGAAAASAADADVLRALRLPHVNAELLRNALFLSNVVDDEGLSSPDDLLHLLEVRGGGGCISSAARLPLTCPSSPQEVNAKLAALPSDHWPDKHARALSKAQMHRFFLGMDSHWVSEL